MIYRSANGKSNKPFRWPGDAPNRQFLMTDLLRRSGYLPRDQDFPTRANVFECEQIGLAFERIPRLEVFRHFVTYRDLYEPGFTMDKLFDWTSFLTRYFRGLRGYVGSDI